MFVEASFKYYTTSVQFTTPICRALLPYHTVRLTVLFFFLHFLTFNVPALCHVFIVTFVIQFYAHVHVYSVTHRLLSHISSRIYIHVSCSTCTVLFWWWGILCVLCGYCVYSSECSVFPIPWYWTCIHVCCVLFIHCVIFPLFFFGFF